MNAGRAGYAGLVATALAGVLGGLALWCIEAPVLIHEGLARGPRRDVVGGTCPRVQTQAPPAERAVFVVLDGVRANLGEDAAVSPTLVALARDGGHGRSRVQSLLPSTIAGIEALATGVSPPPLSIFEDFGASGARTGGVFAAVRAAGMRSAVVGPHLWTDLYGRFIDDAHVQHTVGSDDDAILRDARVLLARREHALLVVHFGACDEATHRFGGDAARYVACVRGYDVRLRALLESIDARTAVVVTSDHGAADVGGHAGPEEAVLEVPLVTAGPGLPRGARASVPQPCVGSYALATLGLDWRGDVRPRVGVRMTAAWLALAALALVVGLYFASAARPSTPARDAWTLVVGLGATLAALLFGWSELGGWLATAALGAVAVARIGRGGLEPGAMTYAGAALVGAVTLGLWRLGDALAQTGATFANVEAHVVRLAGLPAIAIAGLGVGWALWSLRNRLVRRWRAAVAHLMRARGLVGGLAALALVGGLLGGWEATLLALALFVAGASLAAVRPIHRRTHLWLGVLGAALVVLGQRATGETVSLSTTDVRAAYALIDGPLGVGGASLTYAMRMLLPSAAFALGLAVWLRHARREVALAVCGGGALAFFGQTLAAALVMELPDPRFAWVSLGVSLLLRGLGEVVFFVLCVGLAGARRASTRTAA